MSVCGVDIVLSTDLPCTRGGPGRFSSNTVVDVAIHSFLRPSLLLVLVRLICRCIRFLERLPRRVWAAGQVWIAGQVCR